MRMFVAATFVVLATATNAAQAEPGLSVPPGAESFVAKGKLCPMIYKPVCGIKGGRHRTYTNECFAKLAGAKHIRPGACHKK